MTELGIYLNFEQQRRVVVPGVEHGCVACWCTPHRPSFSTVRERETERSYRIDRDIKWCPWEAAGHPFQFNILFWFFPDYQGNPMHTLDLYTVFIFYELFYFLDILCMGKTSKRLCLYGNPHSAKFMRDSFICCFYLSNCNKKHLCSLF